MLAAAQAAPGWLPILFIALPVSIMLTVGAWAVRQRRQWRRSMRGQAGIEPLLKALGARPEDGALQFRESSSSEVLEPHLRWGRLRGRQVFVRMGPDEKVEGDSMMPMSTKHLRTITVLRVAAPAFAAGVRDGAWALTGDPPAALRDLLAGVEADEATWEDVDVFGGPEGIVVCRNRMALVGEEWAYDLWLAERIADALGLEPLPGARIGPSWTVPYGLGRSRTPDGS